MKTYIFKVDRNDKECVNLFDILYIKAEKGRTMIIEIKYPLHFKEVLNIVGDSIIQYHRSYTITFDKILIKQSFITSI